MQKVFLFETYFSYFTRTNFSESPLHLLTMLDAEILKNVVSHSVATAFASNVFPVPKFTQKLYLILMN